MTAPQIDQIISTAPNAPSWQRPNDFPSEADAFVLYIAGMDSEINLWSSQANSIASYINDSITDITASRAVVLAASNFKGLWSNQTGTAAIPYCVYHVSKYWQLSEDLADVTSKTPGTDAEWIEIPYLLDYDHDVDANGYLQTNTVFKNTSEKINSVGSKSTNTTISIEDGNIATITIAGNLTLSFTNWADSGEYSELMLVMTNGGAYTLTFPTINWLLFDGSFTTTFSELDIILQSSGVDFIYLWTLNGGTTIYGKLVR